MRERSILPFALQERAELVTRVGDEEDQLTLMLAPAAHGIETGIAEHCGEKSVVSFSVLGILAGPLQGRERDEKEVDVTRDEAKVPVT